VLLRYIIDADYQLTASSSREPRASTEATPWMESIRRSVMNRPPLTMTMMIQIGNHSPQVRIVNIKCRPWLVPLL